MDTSKNIENTLPNEPVGETQDKLQTGLDQWNKRLDENLEPLDHSDAIADKKAKAYSERYGSGDQSDEKR